MLVAKFSILLTECGFCSLDMHLYICTCADVLPEFQIIVKFNFIRS